MTMRIKIIKNAPHENGCKSIEHLVEKEFDVIDTCDIDEGLVYIKYGDSGRYTIFKGEYEVIQ